MVVSLARSRGLRAIYLCMLASDHSSGGVFFLLFSKNTFFKILFCYKMQASQGDFSN